jgi:Ca2+-binding EF-hand superfamily protein
MSKAPRTPAEFVWSSLKLKSAESASIQGIFYLDIIYYVSQSGYEAFQDDIIKALKIFDKSSKGQISFKDFQEISGSNYDPFAHDESLKAIFNELDRTKEGYLYAEDILEAAKTFKMSLSQAEASSIIESMDLDEDEAVDFKEFKSVVKA